MVATDRDALICDLAETYHILDIDTVPIDTLAILAGGLRETSRSRMRLSGMYDLPENLLLTKISDELTAIRFSLTSRRGDDPPTLMRDVILPAQNTKQKSEVKGFSSGEAFRDEWKRRLRKGGK